MRGSGRQVGDVLKSAVAIEEQRGRGSLTPTLTLSEGYFMNQTNNKLYL